LGKAAAPALAFLRRRDLQAARRVDAYLANSEVVARRIRVTYRRSATVIYPPVDTALYRPTAERSGRFLVVSRLLGYKRIDLAVEAASRLGLPLDVIGDGPERERLCAMAGPTVRLLGRQPDDIVRHAMATCIALVLPGSEDFGLTPVEVQASGRPPVAFASGGALETIEDGRTGFHFPAQTWEAVGAGMRRAQRESLSPAELRASAERFDRSVFADKLRAFIASRLQRRFHDLASLAMGYNPGTPIAISP
jgi:glycosyltransferase involved in cell wall biosynthesis